VLRALCRGRGVPISLVGSGGEVGLLGGRVCRLLGRVAHVLRVSSAGRSAVARVTVATGYGEDGDSGHHGSDADNSDEKDDGAH
jgi:hypothetical protein